MYTVIINDYDVMFGESDKSTKNFNTKLEVEKEFIKMINDHTTEEYPEYYL